MVLVEREVEHVVQPVLLVGRDGHEARDDEVGRVLRRLERHAQRRARDEHVAAAAERHHVVQQLVCRLWRI